MNLYSASKKEYYALGKKFAVYLMLMGLNIIPVASVKAELYFAPELIASDPQMVADLSRFEQSGSQLPGTYQVDIYVNGKLVTTRDLLFVDSAGNENKPQNDNKNPSNIRDRTGLMACLTRKDLDNFGINTRAFPAFKDQDDVSCISPGKYIPDAFTEFDFQLMRLDISIPQAAMRNSARGYISPERWDEGINAALLNYNFSGNNSSGSNGNSSSHYLNLNSGLNLGPWRFRDHRTWNEYSSPYSNYNQWQHIKTYAGRAIIPLRGDMVVGDSSTSGDIFDSLGFRGVQLATDDTMYPDSQRGFAPVIRGTASTNARVSIRQNGYTIYQTFVAPGAFAIDDLYPVSSSGDLEVTVTEADGVARVFTIPYSSVPVLQREGRFKYTLTAGRYRPTGDRYEDPDFLQGTLVWGLPHDVTVYSGVQYSTNYFAGLLGSGLNMGTLGAFSADVTQADSTLADGTRHQGHSLRMLYARTLNSLGTTVQLTGYRYSSQGFHTLDETALKAMKGWLYETDEFTTDGRPVKQRYTDYYNLYNSRRSKLQANISQRIGEQGSVYISGVRQTYRNTNRTSDSLQAGFSSAIGSVNYSLNYSHSRYSGGTGSEGAAFLSLSVPLDSFLAGKKGDRTTYATYSGSRDSRGAMTHQAGLSGSALEGDNLSWNVSQGYAQGERNSGSLGADYRGTYGSTRAGYSYSSNYRQVNYGLSGGALLHAGGLTLGQSLGETSVLVAAPGVAGVALENETGVRTDWRGYAIKPYASVYRENRVALDTASLDDQTEIDEAVSRVVPTRGAVVRATFKGHTGSRVLMTLTRNGKPLPFGSTVTAGERGGIVGDEGQVYLSGLPASGVVKADWGSGRACSARYHLPEKAKDQPVVRINSICS
ncbi:TPA: fimbrial biogenesis usher protein [Enterobacter cancerogenus]